MTYITAEMLDFLAGIRANNTKEWFEAHKDTYRTAVYEPLCALAELLYAPYADVPGMMHKTARIYRDANFPPYLHYRDTMWIYVRHEAMWWSKTPTLFFEVSPDGARFGFRIAAPEPGFMAYFRDMLTRDASDFLRLADALGEDGLTLTGDTYKRSKPCPNEALAPYFRLKSLCVQQELRPGRQLYAKSLPSRIHEVFAAVFPLEEYFQSLMEAYEIGKAVKEAESLEAAEPAMAQAPQEEFMW